jgi:hypothetical protein
MATPATTGSHEDLYRAKRTPQTVDVPPARFLMIDGQGDPNTAPRYAAALQTLYTVAYTLKFAIKKAGGPDERVPPLEGLWWGAEDVDFAAGSKDTWHWTLMMRVPEAADALIEDARATAAAKRPDLPIGELRLEPFDEGRAAQVLHVGPYSAEGATVLALHAFIAEQGHERTGKHHEIYLGDPRRAAPEKLRTVLRQPIR